ncbi:hypothetical protein PAXINDRAFT_103044 [Paxillus involutus ATCC 200175]|uniref:Protein kinase domain-containing protein n=1 Tax=Paxillus involutus ATCC 200175 TaxID=664439 RepID=A0A0C9SN35_PAXIN|nr:hypothetical protein PAXINDRAFT_103044 [Paxillus involutus ATCC 200175]
MTHKQNVAPPAADGRSFITSILQPFGFAAPGPIVQEEEENLRAEIISAAVSTEVVKRKGTNNTVALTFSRSPNDVTEYIKGKGPYPDDSSGGFSDVYKCVLDKPGEPKAVVAVKALRLGTNNPTALQVREKKLRGEVHIWIRLDHPNVLQLYGVADGFSPLPALVSPWVENGTLTKYLEGPGREISKGERISILIKVGEALHYIHSEPHYVVHEDLTGSNILINNEGQPLISDFGLSSILEEYNETSYFKPHRPGASRWIAPELFADLKILLKPSVESDVYSYGCVMLHVVATTTSIPRIQRMGSIQADDKGGSGWWLGNGLHGSWCFMVQLLHGHGATKEQKIVEWQFIDLATIPQDLTGQIVGKEPYPTSIGTFSDVWKCLYRSDQARELTVAVKTIRGHRGDGLRPVKIKTLRDQVEQWKTLVHNNVLPVYGTTRDFGPLPSLTCLLKNGMESCCKYLTASAIVSPSTSYP